MTASTSQRLKADRLPSVRSDRLAPLRGCFAPIPIVPRMQRPARKRSTWERSLPITINSRTSSLPTTSSPTSATACPRSQSGRAERPWPGVNRAEFHGIKSKARRALRHSCNYTEECADNNRSPPACRMPSMTAPFGLYRLFIQLDRASMLSPNIRRRRRRMTN
jgi:hypothetical protein